MQKMGIEQLGFSTSGLTILGGRPAMGKTTLMLSIALDMAMHGTPVAIFSLEMSAKQLIKRLLCNICPISQTKIRNLDKFSDSEFAQISEAMKKLQCLPLFIDDTPSLSVTEFHAKAERLVRKHGVKMIAIDYLQLMSDGENSAPRGSDISKITHSLKELAKELDVTVIALLLLNRRHEENTVEIERPELSDIRMIGAIEQDAETICLIHRPEYYRRNSTENDGNDIKDKAELIYAKCPKDTGIIEMRFQPEHIRFEMLDRNNEYE